MPIPTPDASTARSGRIALFDLDHTLIPFDSSAIWLDYLIRSGVEDAETTTAYLDLCRHYVEGRAGVEQLLGFVAHSLARHEPDALDALRTRFIDDIATSIPQSSLALVRRHADAGDLCCIVTATSRYIAEAFARALGVEQLVASELERSRERFTGRLAAAPCHNEGKPAAVAHWAQRLGLGADVFARACFYSDSHRDMPLLSRVREPIAVCPDARLRAHAQRLGWPILDQRNLPGR